jgi:hypothetical protein
MCKILGWSASVRAVCSIFIVQTRRLTPFPQPSCDVLYSLNGNGGTFTQVLAAADVGGYDGQVMHAKVFMIVN